MKRVLIVVLAFILWFGLSSCAKIGVTKNANIDYGTSEIFNDFEIKSAVNAVIEKFKDFEDCDLQKLYYDEEKYNYAVQDYMSSSKNSVDGVKDENIIILFSDFKVDLNVLDGGGFDQNSYTNWSWVLIRDSKTSEWNIHDWGY